MYTYLIIGSMILGIVALMVPVAGMMFKKMISRRVSLVVSFISFSCIVGSFMLQSLHTSRLVNMAEWEELKEIQDVEMMISLGFSTVTVALNGLFLYKASDYIGIRNKESYD